MSCDQTTAVFGTGHHSVMLGEGKHRSATTEQLLRTLKRALRDLESLRLMQQEDPKVTKLRRALQAKLEELENRELPLKAA